MPFGAGSDDPSHVENIQAFNCVQKVCAQAGPAEFRLWVPGPLPGLNDYVGVNRHKYNSLKKRWQAVISELAVLQGFQPLKSGRFIYDIRELNERRDPSNVCSGAIKVVEDALQACGLLENDGWRGVKGIEVRWSVSARRPGVYLAVEDGEIWEEQKHEREQKGTQRFRRGSKRSQNLQKAIRQAVTRSKTPGVGAPRGASPAGRARDEHGHFLKFEKPE
jgi:hypothetical protein